MILSQFLSFYFCNRALGWLALSPVSPHVDVVSAHKFCSGYAVTYKFEYLFLFPEMNLDTPMKTSQRKKTSVRRLSFQEIFVSKKSSLPSSSCFHHRSGSWKPWLINSRRHSIIWLELFLVKLKYRLALYWGLKLILIFSFQRRFVTHWHWQIIIRAAIIIARSSLPPAPTSLHYHDHNHHWH